MWQTIACSVASGIWFVVCYWMFHRSSRNHPGVFFTHEEIEEEIVLNVQWGLEVPLKMMQENTNRVCIISGFSWQRDNVVIGNGSIYRGKITLRPGRGIAVVADAGDEGAAIGTGDFPYSPLPNFDASCSECQRTAGRGHAVNCSLYNRFEDEVTVDYDYPQNQFRVPLPPTPPDIS